MKLRWLVAVILAGCAMAQTAAEPEIVKAAKSPYELARYIDAHREFDWAPLWSTLGIQAPSPVESCLSECTTEILVIQNPDQVILIVEATPYDLYLRYRQGAAGDWQFAGEYHAEIRNYPRRHQLNRHNGNYFL